MYEYKATITSVYDGDTVTAQVDLGFSIGFKTKFRLARIDTPELRGSEREQGLIVRDLVREKILGKEVTVKTNKDKTGKFGRYIAEIIIDGLNLNQWLLDNGHAQPYD